MADLEPVIRFRKHGVDEKRRALSQLYKEMETVERQKKVIEDQMEKEILMARELNTIEADAYLGKYLEGARKKVKALAISLKKMEARIETAQEDIREAFAEMKKVEITQENRDKREEDALRKKEDKDFDDIGLQGFRRGKEDL